MESKNQESSFDTGLRGNYNGELYVEKKVFFRREDVKKTIQRLKDSKVLKSHIEENKALFKKTMGT